MSVGAVDEAGVVAGAIRSLGHSNVWEAPPDSASLGFTRLTNMRPNPTSANAPAKPA